ncbi:S49 family peptidase [Elioraea sp.]|uniref:S49 family peptidase n=1 Tax=Elioraea sp. TaxID=2185103 RepID=UPI0021DC9949|nr:S49 family peptidase [Elioraea sp.]GIX10366.1 MAG: serine peptidase [Elioraea sp.]
MTLVADPLSPGSSLNGPPGLPLAMHHPRLAQRLFGAPLLVLPAKLDAIIGAVGARIALGIGTPRADGGITVPGSAGAGYAVRNGIAVVPIHGTLVARTGGMDAESGLMSYPAIRATLDRAAADPTARSILLDLDTPGGEVAGLAALADRIEEVSRFKPVDAVANDGAYSAGYWLASAARRIYVTRTGGVGSVGVVMAHIDMTAADEMRGLRWTYIYAGERKIDFQPHVPLSEEARGAGQREVDRLHGLFVDHVARRRRMEPEAVRATQAATFHGEDAVRIGFATAVVSSLDDAVGRIASSPVRGGMPRALSIRSTNMDDDMVGAPPAPQETTAAPPAPSAEDIAASYSAAVAELCTLAGMPERVAEIVGRKVRLAEVGKELLRIKAAEADKRHVSALRGPEAETPRDLWSRVIRAPDRERGEVSNATRRAF